MSKYFSLTSHLASMTNKNRWAAGFGEIEEILGFPLPASARLYPAWWANQGGKGQSLGWQGAGFETRDVDLHNERVTFIYVGGDEESEPPSATQLTIAQAKAGLSATFGVPVDAIEITIRG